MKEIRLCDSGELAKTVRLCMENNLGIEVQTFHDPYIEDMQEQLEKHKIYLSYLSGGKSLHAPFWELNFGTKMRGLKKETMDMFNYAYKIAKELECTEIVVHNGYYPGTYRYGGWINRAIEFWKEFFKGKNDSITMMLENQFELDSKLMLELIDEVNDDRLKICLDIGHVHANSNMTAEDWIRSLGSRIGYLHLHNNHGKQNIEGYNDDEHIGLSDGSLDLKPIFELMEQHCSSAIWSIETNPLYFEESIEYLKKLGYIIS